MRNLKANYSEVQQLIYFLVLIITTQESKSKFLEKTQSVLEELFGINYGASKQFIFGANAIAAQPSKCKFLKKT